MRQSNWHKCKSILCIRPDNMGDLIMSGPAIRALKDSFSANITVLTSTMAAGVAQFMPEIDDVIVFDLPWVKTENISPGHIPQIVEEIKKRDFDAAVIFTVYSQNPLPAAMLAYMAGIPKVLAYCRENPYGLLTDWVPDKEPYELIKHQVRRDLHLVKSIGAVCPDERLQLEVNDKLWPGIRRKMIAAGINMEQPWMILHPGVSEVKRQYPVEKWISAGQRITNELGYQLIFTGVTGETQLINDIITGTGGFSLAGQLNLAELICLVKHAPVMLSVNTGTAHIAAAVNTPVVVLYAQTNPQHTPWKVPNCVLEFGVKPGAKSKNEVILHVDRKLYATAPEMPDAGQVLNALLAVQTSARLSCPPSHEIRGENRAIAAS